MGPNPYQNLPVRNYWRQGVASASPFEWRDLYSKKFDISTKTRVSCAGSCFAQHVGRHLRDRGFNYQDFEPAPSLLEGSELRHKYGYEIYSARFGNIYTARQLRQLFLRASGKFVPSEQVWEQDGRFYDPFRPAVEPEGFASLAEFKAAQELHFSAVRHMARRTDLLVFTLGLTEAWVSRTDGSVYPMCPGTHAGVFDADKYEFKNFSYSEILADMKWVVAYLTRINPRLKLLLTVSPVPLVATATNKHVLVATTYSKSVLRAVAGTLSDEFDFIDYFPSYEIISAPATRGFFYDPNLRTVTDAGVTFVMRHFFSEHGTGESPSAPTPETKMQSNLAKLEVVCEEEILASFSTVG